MSSKTTERQDTDIELKNMRKRQAAQEEADNQFNTEDRKVRDTDFGGYEDPQEDGRERAERLRQRLRQGPSRQVQDEDLDKNSIGNLFKHADKTKIKTKTLITKDVRETVKSVYGTAPRKMDNPKLFCKY